MRGVPRVFPVDDSQKGINVKVRWDSDAISWERKRGEKWRKRERGRVRGRERKGEGEGKCGREGGRDRGERWREGRE